MEARIRDHIRSNVVGYVALFFTLTGGVAWATHPGGADTISSGDIINGEVKSPDVGDGEVKAPDLATDAVTSNKILDRQVKNADLGIGASSSNTIADGGIQNVDVQNDALTGAKVADGSLGGADVANGSLTGDDVGDGGIQNVDVANDTLTGAKVADESLEGVDIKSAPPFGSGGLNGDVEIIDGTVTLFDIGTDQVRGFHVQDSTLTGDDIQDGSVGDADLAPRENVQSPTLSTCDGTNDWSSPVAFAMEAGFWKDRSGVVHLQGSVGCAGNANEGGAIFTLPAGYRPALVGGVVRWPALSSGSSISQIAVLDDGSGAVVYDGPDSAAADDYISLDGLTFRAEG